MTLNIARLRCCMCSARLLSDYVILESADPLHERVEVTCRQRHVVRLTVRKVEGHKGKEAKQ